jgi:hypothetical protein
MVLRTPTEQKFGNAGHSPVDGLHIKFLKKSNGLELHNFTDSHVERRADTIFKLAVFN